MADYTGESDNNAVDGVELYSVGGWPSWGWYETISLGQWVTLQMMVGSLPCVGGWPNFGWWVTLLGMVGDHPGDVWWPSFGKWVTIFVMVTKTNLSSLKNFVSSPGKEWWRRTRWGGRRCQWWQGWCSWSHSQSRSPASLPLTGTLPLDREKLLSAQTPPIIETDYD